jgi:hypothetical protein
MSSTGSEPALVALLFADKIITENNNKKGVIGTFTQFFSQNFPILFPPWAIYAAATNMTGEHEFALTLANAETRQVILPVNGKFVANDKDDVIELGITIMNAVFPKEGRYALEFAIDGEIIGSRILRVNLVKN